MQKCDSCGMPLTPDKTSKHDKKYCIYCQNQETEELAGYNEVRTGSIKAAMDFMGKTRQEAEKMADQILPQLPRWQKEKSKE